MTPGWMDGSESSMRSTIVVQDHRGGVMREVLRLEEDGRLSLLGVPCGTLAEETMGAIQARILGSDTANVSDPSALGVQAETLRHAARRTEAEAQVPEERLGSSALVYGDDDYVTPSYAEEQLAHLRGHEGEE